MRGAAELFPLEISGGLEHTQASTPAAILGDFKTCQQAVLGSLLASCFCLIYLILLRLPQAAHPLWPKWPLA
jgi:hypothetical protein